MAILQSGPGYVIEFPRSSVRSRALHLSATINEHPRAVLAGLSCIYFGLTIALGCIKLLWLDEFITYYIAKLGSLSAIWTALGNGADPNPPLSHLLVLWSSKVFGSSAISLRIPAIFGSFAGIVALYAFLKRRVPPVYACGGVLFFMSTAAFDYSFESRSYALMLGFCALSLVAWRSTIEGNHKNLAAIGLAMSLAAGISSNYFSVLAFFPIAAGEFVRDLKSRKIEWRVWSAMALGGSILLLYLPLVNKAVATFSPYAWNKVQADVIADSYVEMVEIILWPAIGLLAVGVIAKLIRLRWRDIAVLPLHESVAAFVLMLYPFLAYGIARIRGGMLSPRFVIPMCYGFAIAVAATAYRLFGRRAWAGLMFAALLLCWVFARESFVAKMYFDQRMAFDRVIDTLPPVSTIVVTDSLLVLPLEHYAPPQIASHIVFPVDFAAIRQYKKEDSPEQNLWHGRNGIYPVPIVPLEQLNSRTSNYLVAAPVGNWLLRKLIAEGKPARMLPIFTDTKDIQGFTPLCHGPVWFFANGNLGLTSASDNHSQPAGNKALEAHEGSH